MRYITNRDFVYITSEAFVEEGLAFGQRGFIAGHRALPITKEDPYTQRIKFLVHPVVDKHVVFDKLYLLDANSMELVGKKEAKKLNHILEEDLKEYEDAVSD